MGWTLTDNFTILISMFNNDKHVNIHHVTLIHDSASATITEIDKGVPLVLYHSQ